MAFKLYVGFTVISLLSVLVFTSMVALILTWRYDLYMRGNTADFVPLTTQIETDFAQYGWELFAQETDVDFTHSLELSEVFLRDLDGEIRVPNGSGLDNYLWFENWFEQVIPLEAEGQVFGELVVKPLSAEFRYYMTMVFVLSSLGALVFPAIITWIVTKLLVRPILRLTAAANEIATGTAAPHLHVHADDELGQLSVAFNRMNREVTQSREMRKQLTADIAHDIRSPLGLIVGHAEGLRDGIFPDDLEAYELIHDEAMRISRLVEDLSTLSKAEAGILSLQSVPTSPITLLDRVVTAHTTVAQSRDITLQMTADSSLPDVFVDRDRMAQVLDNLVSNALRYTPDGGWVKLTAVQQNDHIRIDVEDNGQGISTADLPHVFQRFYRADKSRNSDLGGSGLGLAIAKWIVQAHNGQITAESPPGKGAIFCIMLPI